MVDIDIPCPYGSGKGFYFWDAMHGHFRVYAHAFCTASSDTNMDTPDAQLLEILNNELSKESLPPEQQQEVLPENVDKYAKDTSEISVASGVLVLRLYERMNNLTAEVENLRAWVDALEGK